MSDPKTTLCACIAGSTYGTADPAIRRCDLCDGIVPTDPVTGEYEDAKPDHQATGDEWGARMGRLEAETGGECGAGLLARDPLLRCDHCGVVLPASCPADEGYGCPSWEGFKEQEAEHGRPT